jgi:subtilisin family serine protease
MAHLQLKNWLAVLLLASPALFGERVPGRYIVELTTEPVIDHVLNVSVASTGTKKVKAATAAAQLRSAAAQTHRARIQAEHQRVRADFEQRNAKVLDSVQTVANALIVQASDADAARLSSLAGVKRVVPVRMMHMVLDRAVVLHKIVDAWNQIGSEHAGAGMKIAIIDSGVDVSHPGLRDSSMTPPDSFPRANVDSDLKYTNGKVIVARSYVNLLPSRDPDESARDRVGHGTALAMTAAGVRNDGPLATITGVAPKAYIGNYKVFGSPGINDGATDDAILKAMDDAVADGMDVINLSLGDDFAPRLEDDLDVAAVERATKAGVIVVIAAGNNGPGLNTITSPATAPSAISVGATTNDRTFATTVEVSGMDAFAAIPGDGSSSSSAITANIADVAGIDGDGLACSSLPSSSLTGKIALILRGTCTFTVKLTNAQRAGAVAAVVYAAENAPDAFGMSVGTATLPAEAVSNADGVAIKQAIAANSTLSATLHFTLSAVAAVGNRITDFSAAGPSVDRSIKPDLMAVGGNFYTATQTLDGTGDMYDPSGYILVDGTSFSTPIVAGAAALIKAARPGLTVDQYRSLLIATASLAQSQTGGSATIQQTGGGLLDASAALNTTATAYPVSLSFGAGGPTVNAESKLTITNVGSSDDTFTITVAPRNHGPAPSVATNTVTVASGRTTDVPVSWSASGLEGGTYEGTINIVSASSGTQLHVPYWYASTTGPAHINILDSSTSGRRVVIYFRVTDASGVALTDETPDVSVLSGTGTVRSIVSIDRQIPGVFQLTVQLGRGTSTTYRIKAGDVFTDLTL